MLTQKNALNIWLNAIFPNHDYTITKLVGDASPRQYYRIHQQNITRILMDSSAEKQSFITFLEISNKLQQQGFPVPNIYLINYQNGLALLDDFGDKLMLNIVTKQNSDLLYKEALNILAKLQYFPYQEQNLPSFNKEFILKELNIFNEWFVEKYLQLNLNKSAKQTLSNAFSFLTDAIQQQPQVFSHMDYHSRNIIIRPNKNNQSIKLGVIDYQDAKIAPFTYDLVSLLKDCYISWPESQINSWLNYFHKLIRKENYCSLSEFKKAFNLCGIQRHLKVLGIFARLYLRDKKNGYLQHIPLIFNYILSCIGSYNELQNLQEILHQQIYPTFKKL